ncbi:isoprenylcysteine carboxylmethyltransferase family protein [Methylomonas sp. UP202]|uniref:methyltransferase family protein n=1 Tax=Methylomonas sp. UP202 TaxID=3040943 RepID=UPI00247A5D92|nr:isoprenylcysteine carboxylmethyltransferase family protein [Methylomonas sp. UP202]WGS84960.1 isoprenylcysteine carboxylmethyltransferase family protein [Methylomonas sp. UP202]
MLAVRLLWLVLALAWLAAEICLAQAARGRTDGVAAERDSQRRLWLAGAAGLIAALYAKQLWWWPLQVAYLPRQALALAIFAAGLSLRYLAVRRLGRFFTTDVTIQPRHELIVDGPYRWLRHPAYTGLLLALAGAGLAMGDGLAVLAATLPIGLAVRGRIAIEEAMLAAEFGAAHADYCAVRWRLLPWLY